MSFDDVNCPYCDKGVEINTDDGYGMEEGKTYNQECEHCGKTFIYTTSIIVIHKADKADCLNGSPHNFRPVVHFPKYWPDWVRCTICGEGKQGRFDRGAMDRVCSKPEGGAS